MLVVSQWALYTYVTVRGIHVKDVISGKPSQIRSRMVRALKRAQPLLACAV
jgi:hypothetical protein